MICDYSLYALSLSQIINELCYNYSYNSEEYRKVSIIAINKLNELIDRRFKEMYADDVCKNSAFRALSPNNIRYCKCVCCKKVDDTTKFLIYGGNGPYINMGFCRECNNKEMRGELNETEISDLNDYRYNIFNTPT